MITAVKKIKEGVYIINDAVIVSNITFSNNQVQYSIAYDHDLINNENAELLADTFIRDAIVASAEDQ